MRTCVIASRLKTVGPTFSVWILNSDIHFRNHKSSWHPPYTVLRSCIHHFPLVLPDKKPADIRRIPEIRHRIQLNFKTLQCSRAVKKCWNTSTDTRIWSYNDNEFLFLYHRNCTKYTYIPLTLVNVRREVIFCTPSCTGACSPGYIFVPRMPYVHFWTKGCLLGCPRKQIFSPIV